ncbi:MAG: SDR family NAD(P)-dependent oxidoreductase [Cyanobacteria bacterium J06632_3]
MRLNEKVALITSSREGVCVEAAHLLAQAGAKIVICGRNAVQGRATVADIQRNGGRACFILTDIAVAADVQAAIDETIATYGRLDILLNSASSYHMRDSSLLEVSETTWDRMTETALKGTFLCCQYAIPFLQNAGNGTIINLVEHSNAGQNHTVEGVCHGGVLALTCKIAQQFSASSITANLIWATDSPYTQLNSLTNKIVYGPNQIQSSQANSSQTSGNQASSHSSDVETPSTNSLADDNPTADSFDNVPEAVMYLATSGSLLHGCILMVTADENPD